MPIPFVRTVTTTQTRRTIAGWISLYSPIPLQTPVIIRFVRESFSSFVRSP